MANVFIKNIINKIQDNLGQLKKKEMVIPFIILLQLILIFILDIRKFQLLANMLKNAFSG